jgi:hypothetical protein
MHRSLTRLTRAAAAVAGVVAVASCGSDSNGPNGNVKDYFSAVQAVVTTGAAPIAPSVSFRPSVGAKTKGQRPLFSATPTQTINATYHSGDVPTGSGGPSVSSAEQGSTPLLGAPFRYSLAGDETFTKVYISVDGASGYWELDLPVSVSVLEMVLEMTGDAGSSFLLQTALGGTGGVGPAHSETITTTDLSNADISATVTWTGGPSDVDLHVIDPNGFEVYYAQDVSPEGGRLNLDSNAGCATDNINQETISWPHGTAPSGHYKVVVEYYDDCLVSNTSFTGQVFQNGTQIKSFSGSFSGVAGANTPPFTAFEFDR